MRSTFAPATIKPHVPVATAVPNTCGECRYAIGFPGSSDTVHAVKRQCQCGKSLPPFTFECDKCRDERYAARDRARLVRLGQAPTDADDAEGEAREIRQQVSSGRPDLEFQAMYREATEYLRAYTGTFEFLLDMKRKLDMPTKWENKLSRGQVEAVLKCKARDIQRQQELATKRNSGIDLNKLPEGTTRYAVENDGGELTFLRFDRVTSGKWAGWTFVKQIVGGGNDHPLGKQRPGATYEGVWEKMVFRVVADPIKAARRYGMEIGECSMCARTLTDAESRRLGIGPVCREKFGA